MAQDKIALNLGELTGTSGQPNLSDCRCFRETALVFAGTRTEMSGAVDNWKQRIFGAPHSILNLGNG